jgi:hypothetical protein
MHHAHRGVTAAAFHCLCACRQPLSLPDVILSHGSNFPRHGRTCISSPLYTCTSRSARKGSPGPVRRQAVCAGGTGQQAAVGGGARRHPAVQGRSRHSQPAPPTRRQERGTVYSILEGYEWPPPGRRAGRLLQMRLWVCEGLPAQRLEVLWRTWLPWHPGSVRLGIAQGAVYPDSHR